MATKRHEDDKNAKVSPGGPGGQHAARVTTDHEFIRKWAEERGASPACVRGTGGKGDIGMLRLDFPGYSGEGKLEHIDWEDWFAKFDERKLALLYQEETSGGERSNFNKIISRETAEQREELEEERSHRRTKTSGGQG